MHLHSLVVAALCSGAVTAQMSGTFVIDPAGPAGAFPSFTAAVNAMFVVGVNGPSTFSVAPGAYTETVLVPPISGSGPANRITFRSRDGRGTALLTGAPADCFTMWGTSFFRNSSITWDGLDFMGANGHAIITTQWNENMEILNCFMDGTGFVNLQPGAFRHALLVVEMNNNELGWRIRNNKIKFPPHTTSPNRQGYGFYLSNCGGFEIDHNEIDLNGCDYGFWLINNNRRLDSITNNLITGSLFTQTSATASWNGVAAIRMDISNYVNDIAHNTFVVSITGNGCVISTGGFLSGGSPVTNNIVGNVFVLPAGGAAICITDSSAQFHSTSNYNVFHVPNGANVGRLGPNTSGTTAGTNYLTLAAWTAASTRDANSVEADPLLMNGVAPPYDLHPVPGSPVQNLSAGTPTYITTDYDGRYRDAMPDAGAYETTSFAVFGTGCPGTGGLVPAVGSSGTVAIGSPTFVVEGSNMAQSSIAILIAGLSNTVSNLGPLPFGIGGDCFVRVSPDTSFFNFTSPTGTTSQPFPIPNNPAFIGLSVYFQWAVVDPAAASVYGIAMSNGGALQL